MKKVLTGLAAILITGVVLAIIAPFVIDLNKHKDTILAGLEPYIASEVDFQRLELTLWRGLGAELHGFRIADSPVFSEEDFLRLDSLLVRVQLLPLLKKQIKVAEIIVNEPVVRLVRTPDGRFNAAAVFAFGKKMPPEEAPPPDKSREKSAGEQGPGRLSALLVNKIQIRQGKMFYRDETLFPGAGPLTIDSCDLTLQDVSLVQPIAVTLAADLMATGRQNLHLEGTLGPAGEALRMKEMPFDCKLTLQKLALDRLESRLPEGTHMKGPVELKVTSAGRPQKFQFAVNADMKALEIQYKNLLRKPVQTPLSLTCRGVKEGPQITWKALELVLHNLSLSAPEPWLMNLEKLQFDGAAEIRVASLSGWDALVPGLSGCDLEGSLMLRGDFGGTPQDASVDMQLTSDRIHFHCPVSENRPSSAPPRKGRVDGVRLDAGGSRQAGQITGRCRINVEQGEVCSVPFQQLFVRLDYIPDRLDIVDLDMEVFQGTLQGTGQYHITQGEWTFQPVVKKIPVSRPLHIFTDYGDDFSGTFSGTFQARGSTRTAGESSPAVKGSFSLVDGALKNLNLVERVLDELLGIKGLARYLAEKKRKIKRHDTTRFDALQGEVAVKGTTLHVNALQLQNIRTTRATDARAEFTGNCFLQKKTLDLKGRIFLSPAHSQELVEKASALEALLDSEKRMILPVTVQGPLHQPVPVLDQEYILRKLAQQYRQKAVDKGMEKLREKVDLPEEAEQLLEKSAEKIFEELFGK